MKFEQVANHAELKKQLIETIQHNRVSHSQLFYGPEGNGALMLAISFAQYLFCNSPGPEDSCGVCPSCRQTSSFNYPDLHFAFPVAKTEKGSLHPISVEYLNEWKSLVSSEGYFGIYRWLEVLGIEKKQAQISVHESSDILRKLQLKPYLGKYKVMIIWLPERMNSSAANKLLKLLEEPPQKTLFLLVSEDPDALLKTITSRCQKTFVPKYRQAHVSSYLQEQEGIDQQTANVISKVADGNMAHAKMLAERAETYRDYAVHFSSWVRSCFSANLKNMLEWSEVCSRFDREKLKDFLTFCGNTFRDSLNIHYGSGEDFNAVFKEINFKLQDFAPFIHASNSPQILEGIDTAAYDISRNANPKVVLADLSIRMARYLRIKP